MATGAADPGFASWLDDTREVLARETAASVPCGTCTACCRASQFVHVQPHERRTLERIPKSLLFPAPGRPRGHLLLGYDEEGRCPMLVDDACAIYEDRPIACRTYDCRVFAATGIAAGAEGHPIELRVRSWRFAIPTARDDAWLRAVRAAASFLAAYPGLFPPGFVPRTPAQLAILAIKVCGPFVDCDVPSDPARLPELVDAIVAEYRRFPGGGVA